MLNANNCWHFNIYEQDKLRAQLSWIWKKFYNLGAWWLVWVFASSHTRAMAVDILMMEVGEGLEQKTIQMHLIL